MSGYQSTEHLTADQDGDIDVSQPSSFPSPMLYPLDTFDSEHTCQVPQSIEDAVQAPEHFNENAFDPCFSAIEFPSIARDMRTQGSVTAYNTLDPESSIYRDDLPWEQAPHLYLETVEAGYEEPPATLALSDIRPPSPMRSAAFYSTFPRPVQPNAYVQPNIAQQPSPSMNLLYAPGNEENNSSAKVSSLSLDQSTGNSTQLEQDANDTSATYRQLLSGMSDAPMVKYLRQKHSTSNVVLSGKVAQCLAHRYTVAQPPFWNPLADPTVRITIDAAETLVEEFIAALNNVTDIVDDADSLDVNKVLNTSDTDKEAVCWRIIEAIIHRCVVGFEGPGKEDATRQDLKLTCRQRVIEVSKALSIAKTICRDVLISDEKIKLLVHQPTKLVTNKRAQKINNDRRTRQTQEKAAKAGLYEQAQTLGGAAAFSQPVVIPPKRTRGRPKKVQALSVDNSDRQAFSGSVATSGSQSSDDEPLILRRRKELEGATVSEASPREPAALKRKRGADQNEADLHDEPGVDPGEDQISGTFSLRGKKRKMNNTTMEDTRVHRPLRLRKLSSGHEQAVKRPDMTVYVSSTGSPVLRAGSNLSEPLRELDANFE